MKTITAKYFKKIALKRDLNIQDIVALLQVAIAMLMTFSLFQMNKSLEINREQLEMSKVPVLEEKFYVSLTNRLLVVENVGETKIKHLQLLGIVSAYVDRKTSEIGAFHAQSSSSILKESIGTGVQFGFSPDSYIKMPPSDQKKPNDDEVFAVVFRFRSISLRPYHKVIYFSRYVNSDYTNYLSLTLNSSSSISASNLYPYKKIRDGLNKLCVDVFDLPTNFRNEGEY